VAILIRVKSRPSLSALRKQIFLPTDGTVLLNAGTMSPTPKAVMAAAEGIRAEQASNPHRFFFERHGQHITKARATLAKYLRVEKNDLFLVPNVTIALNFAIFAIDAAVREGKLKRNTVLVSSLEYGSIALAWRNASALKVEVVPVHHCQTWDEIVAAFRKQMNKKTIAICMSHIAQPNGRVLPVKALVDLARERGVLSVIDGAHVPGMLPLDLESLGADAYGANVHKWMMGLANSGFLHVSKAMKNLLRPMFVSWGLKDLRADNRDTFAPFYGGTQLQGAIEFWGCVDRVPQMVLPQTIEFLNLVGEERMRARMKELSLYLRKEISPLLEPLGFSDPEQAVALTAFKLPECDRGQVRAWFWKRKIAIGATRLREDVEGRHDEVVESSEREAFLRVSTAWFNTESDIDHLRDATARWLRR
jgi:isopenicillin-N epimerase